MMAAEERSHDWQLNKSLVDCNRTMMEESISWDVSFQVGLTEEGCQEIRAHRYVLVSRSPVFFAMLCSDLSANNSQPIRVPDVEPKAFRQLLRYIYCDEADLTSDLVLHTLYASKKYLVPTLTEKCITFLEDNLDPDNVGLIMEQSILYDEASLVEKCNAYIETRTEEVLNSSSFRELSHDTLMNILRFDSLAVSELDVFRACLDWAEEACRKQGLNSNIANKREVLGDALYLIHFPTIPMKEFASIVAKTGVLTAEEKCAVFEYLAIGEDAEGASAEVPFPTSQRQKPTPSILKRFTNYGKSNVYSGDCSILKLMCDKPILIKGFGVNGSISYDALAEIQVTIKQDRNFLCNRTISITDDRSGDVIQVNLPECVSLHAGTWYTLIVTFHFFGDHDQGSCRRGKGGSKMMSWDGVQFEFDRPDSAGFVPEVLFCRTF